MRLLILFLSLLSFSFAQERGVEQQPRLAVPDNREIREKLKLPNDASGNTTAVYWVDHDGGFDIDDFIAHTSMRIDLENVIGVSTTCFHPEYKAKLSSLVLQQIGLKNVPVYAGLGIYPGEEADFSKRYPAWPPQFGAPYPHQGKAYEDVFGKEAIEKIEVKKDAVDAIIKAAHEHAGKFVFVALAPLTNLAAALKKDPTIADAIERVVVMGGWFQNEKGEITRLGYNTALDLDAFQTVFSQTKFKILLMNSQTIKNQKFVIKRKNDRMPWISYEELVGLKDKNAFGRAFYEDMKLWENHSKNTMGDIVLADPVTVHLAGTPVFVNKMRTVSVSVNPKPELHMLSPQAGTQLTVTENPESKIYVIDEFFDPEMIRIGVLLFLREATINN